MSPSSHLHMQGQSRLPLASISSSCSFSETTKTSIGFSSLFTKIPSLSFKLQSLPPTVIVGQIMSPQKCPWSNLCNLRICDLAWKRVFGVAIKVEDLGWEITLGFLSRPNLPHEFLETGTFPGCSHWQMWWRVRDAAVLLLRTEKGARAEDCSSSLDAGKVKGTGS